MNGAHFTFGDIRVSQLEKLKVWGDWDEVNLDFSWSCASVGGPGPGIPSVRSDD